MYRKRRQNKRGGWPEFLDTALEDAKQKASDLMGNAQQSAQNAIGNAQQSAQNAMGNVQQSAQNAMGNVQSVQSESQYGSGDVSTRFVPESVMLSNDQNVPYVQEGGKSRRKRNKRNKRTKRSSVRQRR